MNSQKLSMKKTECCQKKIKMQKTLSYLHLQEPKEGQQPHLHQMSPRSVHNCNFLLYPHRYLHQKLTLGKEELTTTDADCLERVVLLTTSQPEEVEEGNHSSSFQRHQVPLLQRRQHQSQNRLHHQVYLNLTYLQKDNNKSKYTSIIKPKKLLHQSTT